VYLVALPSLLVYFLIVIIDEINCKMSEISLLNNFKYDII